MTAVQLLFLAVLVVALLVLSVQDIRQHILRDIITLPLVALGLAYSQIATGTLVDATIGAALGYLAFVSVELSYKAMRGVDGLGRGDAKLLAAGGAWAGWSLLPMIVVIAAGSGLIWGLSAIAFSKDRKAAYGKEMPFGPFLSLGIAAAVLGQAIGWM